MGKGNELWDDSALVNAFDRAMTSYQEMHSNENCGKSPILGGNISDCNENDLVHSQKEARHVEPGNNSSNISSAIETEVQYNNTEAADDDLIRQGNIFGADKYHTKSNSYPSGIPRIVEETCGYATQQNSECDELVKQYYEVEEQKQRIIEQLHKANYWFYPTPNHSSTYQPPQVSGYNASEYSSCPMYSWSSACDRGYCCYPVQVACNFCYPAQMACCSGSQAHQVPDDSAIKEGMVAVERAVKSMKMKMPEASIAGEEEKLMYTEEKGKENGSGISEGEESQSIGSGSDLSTVLNAWYVAGFHTGRYFAKQSKNNVHK